MSVNKIQCLDCGVNVEMSGAKAPLRCGPCGTRYHEADTQRRREGRLTVNKQGTVTFKGMGPPMAVFVEDVSYQGARIRYPDDASPFTNGKTHGDSILTMDVAELQLHTVAKVVWTASLNKKESRMGLRFLWHS